MEESLRGIEGWRLTTFDFVADPSLPKAVPLSTHGFKKGDLARHPGFPGWIFQWTGCHQNPRVGWWELVFILEGAVWPRPHNVPEVGSHHELGYSTLDPINEMELLALVSQ
jgi:hypothetical protein